MPELNGQDIVTNFAGNFNFNTGGMSPAMVIVWVIFSVVVAGLILYGIYFLLMVKFRYKYTIKVYGNVGGDIKLRWKDKGWKQRMSTAGDEVLNLLRTKRNLPVPTIEMGAFEVWYFEREDGELINIGMEDLNIRIKDGIKQGIIKCKFIDHDMRMFRLAIDRNLKFRHQKQNFWDKYGGMIINAGFMLIVIIGLVVLFYQLGKVLPGVIDSASSVIDKADIMMSKAYATSCGGGGSAVPVPNTPPPI